SGRQGGISAVLRRRKDRISNLRLREILPTEFQCGYCATRVGRRQPTIQKPAGRSALVGAASGRTLDCYAGCDRGSRCACTKRYEGRAVLKLEHVTPASKGRPSRNEARL